MRRTFVLLLALVAVATAATLGSGGPAAAQADTGTVTVIHGVPGVTVDVYVNDDLTLEAFEPETVTDPLELPAGDYTVDIRAAGADPSEDPIITGSTTLPAGANATLIAHLTADGTPTLGVFVNDTAPTAAGEGRLVVRHTAAAPAVDVLAGGSARDLRPREPGRGDPLAARQHGVRCGRGRWHHRPGDRTGRRPGGRRAGDHRLRHRVTRGRLPRRGRADHPGRRAGSSRSRLRQSGAPADQPMPVPSGVPAGDSGLAADAGSSFPAEAALAAVAVALVGAGIVGPQPDRGPPPLVACSLDCRDGAPRARPCSAALP